MDTNISCDENNFFRFLTLYNCDNQSIILKKIWIDKVYEFNPHSLQRIKQSLRYWAHSYGFDDIINASEEDKYNSVFKNNLQCTINNSLISFLNEMDIMEQIHMADLYTNTMSCNNHIINKMPLSTHQNIIEWLQTKFPNNEYQQYIRQIDDTINETFVTGKECNLYFNEYKSDYRVERDHMYFPTGSKYWMKKWLSWLFGECSMNDINNSINEWKDEDGITGKNSDWYPNNFLQLHKMHVACCDINNIILINNRTRINMLTNHNNRNIETHVLQWSYDPWINDVIAFYQIPKIRQSLMMPIDQFAKIRKTNPVHLNQPQGQNNHGTFHPSMTRFARCPLFFWLENVTFILDNFNTKPMPQTLLVTSGTFLFHLNESIFGICKKVIAKHWSLQFVKNKITRLIELAENFHDDFEKLSTAAKNSDFDMLKPIYEIELLQLQWQYSNCSSTAWNHNHHHAQDHILWLDITNITDNNLQPLIQQIQINDTFTIADLNIGGIVSLNDLNADDYPLNHIKHDKWYWKYIIKDKYAMNPLGSLAVHEFLYQVLDPLKHIMPGLQPISTQEQATVFIGQFNCDGFTTVKYENTISPKQSVSQNYIAPMHCVTGNKLIISVGTTTEMGNNEPWIDCFVVDVIRSLFLGFEVNITNEQTLTVFSMIPFFLLDGKEVKNVSGIAGPNNVRLDYYTIIPYNTSHADVFIQPERHHATLLTQQHINYLRNICNIMGNIAGAMHISNNRSRRDISVHNTQMIKTILRYAGISPTLKPKIEQLPTLSLIKVEFCHLMFHHILPRLCIGIKNTFDKYHNSDNTKAYLEDVWKKFSKNDFSPSKVSTTYFRNSTTGSKVTMKAINVYNSALMLAYNGVAMGFDYQSVNVLKRVMQWIGFFFSGCLNNNSIEWLQTECIAICNAIDDLPHIKLAFGESPCLRSWRNLIFVDFYIWSIPNDFVGFMFEAAHKPTVHLFTNANNHNIHSSITAFNQRQRIIKNVNLIACGYSNLHCTLGDGISELLTQIKSKCKDWCKFICFGWNDENQIVHLQHVITMKRKYINCNFLSKIIWKWQSFKYSLNKNTKAYQPYMIKKHLHLIAAELIVSQARDKSRANILRLYNAIKYQQVKMYVCKGFASFNLSYLDSHFRLNNVAWIRQPNIDDIIVSIVGFVGFENIHQSNLYQNIFNATLTKTPEDFLLIIGKKWKCKNNPHLVLNYENFSINSSPIVGPTDETIIVSCEYAIQQMMSIHDHIIPHNEQLHCMRKIFSWFPLSSRSNFPKASLYQQHSQYCGPVWICHICKTENCLHHLTLFQKIQHGFYRVNCCTKYHPWYKLFGFPQGYLPRLAVCKSIYKSFDM